MPANSCIAQNFTLALSRLHCERNLYSSECTHWFYYPNKYQGESMYYTVSNYVKHSTTHLLYPSYFQNAGLSFIICLSTAGSSNRNSTSAGRARGTCCTQGTIKGTLFFCIFFTDYRKWQDYENDEVDICDINKIVQENGTHTHPNQ